MAYTRTANTKRHTHTHNPAGRILHAVAATCVYTSWALVLFLTVFTLTNGL